MGKRFIFILMACSLLSIATVVHAQHIDKQTYIFAIKKVDTLKLDKYVMIDQIQGTQSKPVILFAFGGGFKGGRRDNPDYISYFHFLARAGYVVVSTDYRTQLKDIDKSEYSDLQGFSSALQQAITCAVEDFGDATNYIIEHSVEWQINPAQIIACGSSAGAITALQAEYEICNQTAFADRLPANFNYAGVISFSGAICANGIPKWIMSPCPLMLFHGDADSTVPFTKNINALIADFLVSHSEAFFSSVAAECNFTVTETSDNPVIISNRFLDIAENILSTLAVPMGGHHTYPLHTAIPHLHIRINPLCDRLGNDGALVFFKGFDLGLNVCDKCINLSTLFIEKIGYCFLFRYRRKNIIYFSKFLPICITSSYTDACC